MIASRKNGVRENLSRGILYSGFENFEPGKQAAETDGQGIWEDFPDVVDNFSKSSRPRTANSDDEEHSIVFGGRPSTSGSVMSQPVFKPETPAHYDLSLVRVSCTTVRLRCQNPNEDLLQITEGYNLPWASVYWVNGPRYMAREVTCLRSGTLYRFRLKNKPSVPHVVVTTFAFPAKPSIPTCWKIGYGMPVPVSVTTDFISVSWVNPNDVQQWEMAIAKAIDGRHGLEPGKWKRCGNVGGHGRFGMVSAGRMFYEFPHLRANMTYFIRIRFRNNSGWSKSSRPLEVSTSKGEVASAPQNFIIVHPLYYSYLSLQWSLPDYDGDLPLLEALVEYVAVADVTEESDADIKIVDKDPEADVQTYSAGLNTRVELPNLEPDTLYHVRVRYRNEQGLGAHSAVLQARTSKFWVPRPPRAPTLEYVTSTMATVWFKEQVHDHVQLYEVQYSKDRLFRWSSGGKGLGSPILVEGLEPNTHYFFRVKARNKRGWSRPGATTLGKTKVIPRVAPHSSVDMKFLRNTPTTITVQCQVRLGTENGINPEVFGDNCLYQVEYSVDRENWKRAERHGNKGIVRITKLRPATHYFARVRFQDSTKVWSAFADPVLQMATRDYGPGDHVLAHGEGPWEMHEGYYPVDVLKALKVGEYYLIRREGRGKREDVVHRDLIKEHVISPVKRAKGRVGRLLARSTTFKIVKGRHTFAAKPKRNVPQSHHLADRHDEVNQYLFLKGLPQGSVVETSKIVRMDQTPRYMAYSKRKKDKTRSIKSFMKALKRPVHLLRDKAQKSKETADAEERSKRLNKELIVRGKQDHVLIQKKLHKFLMKTKDMTGEDISRNIISR
eukprot:g8119.t1